MKQVFAAVAALAIVACSGATTAWAQSASHVMVTPNDLKWTSMPTLPPGAMVVAVIEGPLDRAVPFILRLTLPPNYQIPAHWHPWIEHVTVLSGTLNMGVRDKLDRAKTNPLPAGSVAVIQQREPFFLDRRGNRRAGPV